MIACRARTPELVIDGQRQDLEGHVVGAIKGADLLHRDENRIVAEKIAGEAMHINLTDNAAFKAKFAKSLKFPSR